MVHRKRIVVLEGNGLMSAGVYSLLTDRASIEVVGVKLGAADAVAQLDALQPEVIVIDQNVMTEHFEAFKTILKNHFRRIRIIVLYQDKNRLEIWDKRAVSVKSLDDFLDLL